MRTKQIEGSDRLPFAIRIKKWNAEHRGGTKRYELISLSAPSNTGPYLIIARYGKLHAEGQVNINCRTSTVTTSGPCTVFNEAQSVKQGRGYTIKETAEDFAVTTLSGLRRYLPTVVMRKLHEHNGTDGTYLSFLFSELHRETFAEGDSDVITEPPVPLKLIENEVKNPNWGAF